jgi:hypothetical protein
MAFRCAREEEKLSKTDLVSIDEHLLRKTWGPLLERDPFYNPNLSLVKPGYGMRFLRSRGDASHTVTINR